MLNWYLQNGKESDVVISSRIRIARNLNDIPFEAKCTLTQAKEVMERLANATNELGYGLKFLKLEDMDDITKMSLIEKHIISPDFVLNQKPHKAIIINEDENICIMVNEEDHIRIQTLASGLELENLLNLSKEIDEKLEKIVNYAYNEKYGFLTSCPTNVGTGIRASVMVHLPGLTLTNNINQILEVVNDFGMNIRGIYGEGSKSQGNIYQISNKQSLGISEEEIIKNLKVITEKIIEQERNVRKHLAKNDIGLEDRVYRAYGVLANCRKISWEECESLLSDVKLGTDLGIITELTDLKVSKLELYTKPANLQKKIGKTLNTIQRDLERAKIIKEIINNVN